MMAYKITVYQALSGHRGTKVYNLFECSKPKALDAAYKLAMEQNCLVDVSVHKTGRIVAQFSRLNSTY